LMNIMAQDSSGKPHQNNVKLMLSFHGSTTLNNVPDPYYGGADGFEEVLDLLEVSCANLLNKLRSID
ncbi:MAG: low molecular weight phosphotyrosine protein phosphatase, partial [Sumerlaeia bacterium]